MAKDLKPTRKELARLLDKLRSNESRDTVELQNTRRSFAISNLEIERADFSRSSVEMISRSSILSEDSTKLSPLLEAKNLLLAYDLTQSYIKMSWHDVRKIASPFALQQIHHEILKGISIDAGKYRASDLRITGTAFAPPDSGKIDLLVEAMCDYIVSNWSSASPFHLAAFALWRLLWIHPFSDANGRLARTWAYAIICSKLGLILTGSPTLPEILLRRKNEYYMSLEAADAAEALGQKDVSKLERLLEQAFAIQLTGAPLLPDRVQQTINKCRVNIEKLISLDGVKNLGYRQWMDGPVYNMYIDSPTQIDHSTLRESKFGNPFPNLIEYSRLFDGSYRPKFQVYIGKKILGSQKVPLQPNDGIIFHRCLVSVGMESYEIKGCLISVSLGSLVPLEEISTVFEILTFRFLRAFPDALVSR